MPCKIFRVMTRLRNRSVRATILAAFCLLAMATGTQAGTPVTTYHYDNLRTGWDQTETLLTPATVGSSAFGLLGQVTLDDQVDVQPLFLPSVQMSSGTHDVVYVATENNTVYAIDAQSSTLLVSRNFGTPVGINSLPGQCSNNANNVGIDSTPVIDPATNILYVMTYTAENGQAVFRLHALDAATLADRLPNIVVSATGKLGNGSTVAFSAAYQRQRAALLLASSHVYAAFASYCDFGTNVSRGWLLGWSASKFVPLPGNELVDRRPTSPNTYFMSSIWMSGFGPAADAYGNIYFATSNSDYSGNAYNPLTNLSESVVRLAPDLTTSQGHFTPENHAWMDENDGDLGAGGVLLLPPQPNSPNLAVAAGKFDNIFLLDRDLFKSTSKPASLVLGQYPSGGCWCGESYYTGSDGIGRVVTSVSDNVGVWKVSTGARPTLTNESTSPNLGGGQDPGFFTVVSSNATQPNTAVIWAVAHPSDNDSSNTLTLKAFDPSQGSAQIFAGTAGNWPFAANSNANVVPLVADGRVFVPTYGSLAVFGLSAGNPHAVAHMTAAPAVQHTLAGHQLYGTLVSSGANTLSVRLRDSRVVKIDTTSATTNHMLSDVAPGHGVQIRGAAYNIVGQLEATVVGHAKDSPKLWGVDR